MASEQQKTTYTAAEVAVLEETILKQKAEIDELKRKLEHMNEVFANAQRARFGQSSEKASYVMSRDQMILFNEAESCQNYNAEEVLLKHSLASPSTVADVMTKKYADGLPLARQEKIWAREGGDLSRATMANWVIQCTQVRLKSLLRHMKQQPLEQSVIHADETVVQVLKEEGKPATSGSRMWVYASGERSKKHIRIFEYQARPKWETVGELLKGLCGLSGDGWWVCWV